MGRALPVSSGPAQAQLRLRPRLSSCDQVPASSTTTRCNNDAWPPHRRPPRPGPGPLWRRRNASSQGASPSITRVAAFSIMARSSRFCEDRESVTSVSVGHPCAGRSVLHMASTMRGCGASSTCHGLGIVARPAGGLVPKLVQQIC
jgi:hypothetical protein